MADPTVTVSKPAPYLEAAGDLFIQAVTGLTGKPIDTSTFAPQVAGQGPLSQAAQQAAATQAGLGTLQFDPTTGAVTGVGAGTGVAGYQPFLQQAAAYSGPQAYQQFMSPYQQEVIDTSLAEFDKQRAIAQQQIGAGAIGAGAFGGGREGVQRAEFGAQSLQDRSLLSAQLRQQGFQQAQQAAAQAQQQQMGLASLQPSLAQANIQSLGQAGTQNLAYQQAVLDAQAQGAQMAAYEPYNRLQFLGSAIGGMLSGQPQAYMTSTTPGGAGGTASPLSSALSSAFGVYGLGSLFR
jgi:hypothetical protein